jgi:hypothetical protein
MQVAKKKKKKIIVLVNNFYTAQIYYIKIYN